MPGSDRSRRWWRGDPEMIIHADPNNILVAVERRVKPSTRVYARHSGVSDVDAFVTSGTQIDVKIFRLERPLRREFPFGPAASGVSRPQICVRSAVSVPGSGKADAGRAALLPVGKTAGSEQEQCRHRRETDPTTDRTEKILTC